MEVKGRARAERTENINAMLVTLDVSKLSGWLNADAPCPVERRAFKAGRVWAGRRKRAGRWRCKERAGEGPKGDQGVRGTGGAHPKHGPHGGDVGRVEAQRLVELRRVLPSQKEGIQGRRKERGLGGASVWAGCRARSVRARI